MRVFYIGYYTGVTMPIGVTINIFYLVGNLLDITVILWEPNMVK